MLSPRSTRNGEAGFLYDFTFSLELVRLVRFALLFDLALAALSGQVDGGNDWIVVREAIGDATIKELLGSSEIQIVVNGIHFVGVGMPRLDASNTALARLVDEHIICSEATTKEEEKNKNPTMSANLSSITYQPQP